MHIHACFEQRYIRATLFIIPCIESALKLCHLFFVNTIIIVSINKAWFMSALFIYELFHIFCLLSYLRTSRERIKTIVSHSFFHSWPDVWYYILYPIWKHWQNMSLYFSCIIGSRVKQSPIFRFFLWYVKSSVTVYRLRLWFTGFSITSKKLLQVQSFTVLIRNALLHELTR